MKKRVLEYVIMLSVVVALVVLDIVTKVIASSNLIETSIEVIPNFFKLVYIENTGAAFGMFSENTLFLAIFSLVFIIVFIVFDIFNHSTNWFYRIGYVMVFAGAIGNFIDRIFLGYVRDFLSFSIFPFVFNVADIFITVGVGLLAIYIIFFLFRTEEKK